MTLSRRKVMACTLGLSLGSLALVAGQPNNKLNAQRDVSNSQPAAVTSPQRTAPPSPATTDPPPIVIPSAKPVQVPSAPETLPPASVPNLPATLPVAPMQELEILVPMAPTSAAPIAAPVAVEKELDPLVGSLETLPQPRISPPKERRQPYVESGILAPPPVATAPPSPLTVPAPVAQPAVQPPPTYPFQAPSAPPYPPTNQGSNVSPASAALPPPLIQPQPTPTVPPPDRRPGPPATSKLKMLLRLGDGKPRFEIRNTGAGELLLKVYGEKIEMQSAPEGVKNSPIAGVTAGGNVRFAGPGIEGTCDQLSVLSGSGEVMLKGNIHLKTKRGKAWSEMTADKMIYQIGASGLSSPASAKPVSGESNGY